MVLEHPLWSAGPEGDEFEHSALLDRRLVQAVFRTGGVLRAHDASALEVTQRSAGANMSVDIQAGMCIIPGTSIGNQGNYLCRSTAVENRSVAAAPGSGSRTDLVVARVRDSSVTGTQDGFFIEVLTGTTTTPDDAIALASITVSSGQSSVTDDMITDLRELASPGGGIELPADSYEAAATPSAWPQGLTFMRTTSASGYPDPNGLVVMYNVGTNMRTTQKFYGAITGPLVMMYTRRWDTGSSQWSPWQNTSLGGLDHIQTLGPIGSTTVKSMDFTTSLLQNYRSFIYIVHARSTRGADHDLLAIQLNSIEGSYNWGGLQTSSGTISSPTGSGSPHGRAGQIPASNYSVQRFGTTFGIITLGSSTSRANIMSVSGATQSGSLYEIAVVQTILAVNVGGTLERAHFFPNVGNFETGSWITMLGVKVGW